MWRVRGEWSEVGGWECGYGVCEGGGGWGVVAMWSLGGEVGVMVIGEVVTAGWWWWGVELRRVVGRQIS